MNGKGLQYFKTEKRIISFLTIERIDLIEEELQF
jgi:hypothetical protein